MERTRGLRERPAAVGRRGYGSGPHGRVGGWPARRRHRGRRGTRRRGQARCRSRECAAVPRGARSPQQQPRDAAAQQRRARRRRRQAAPAARRVTHAAPVRAAIGRATAAVRSRLQVRHRWRAWAAREWQPDQRRPAAREQPFHRRPARRLLLARVRAGDARRATAVPLRSVHRQPVSVHRRRAGAQSGHRRGARADSRAHRARLQRSNAVGRAGIFPRWRVGRRSGVEPVPRAARSSRFQRGRSARRFLLWRRDCAAGRENLPAGPGLSARR